ncbi:hypothetical protein ACHAWC_003288, partial [Mediolabrus comicus]
YYEHHAPQRSQSCGPHSRYPSSSRGDDYCHQERHRERNYPSHFRKRWRSPDSSSQNVQQNHDGFNRSRRQKGIGKDRQQDTSYERRPLGSINGAEMQRDASHPMTSNGSQRNDNTATLSLGRNGVNNMSSYHQNHHPVDASHHRRPLVSSNGQVRRQAPQFNKINDIPTLIQTAYSSLSAMSMSPSNTAAFWNSLAKQLGRNNQLNLSYDQMGSHINQLFQHTRRTLGSFGMNDLTQTTYSMAKLADLLRKRHSNINHRKDIIASSLSNLLLNDDATININKDLFLSLANESLRKLDQFDARHISNLAYAYALIRLVPVLADGSDLFDHIAMQAIKMRAEFAPQNLSNMVWAYATVKKRHDALFKAMGDEVVAHDHLRDFRPQHLSNTVWAYATAGVNHPQLFEKVANHIDRLGQLTDFKPQELSNIVWAYATAEISHPKLFEKMANHIAGLDHLREFKPQNLSNTVWAYATAGDSHPILFAKIANHIVGLKSLDRFTHPQDVSNTVWAYATAGVNHPQLFDKMAKHIVSLDHLRDFRPQALSNIVWAYATAEISHPKLFEKVSNHIVQLDHLGDFKPQHLSNIVWAYATAGVNHPLLFQKVANHIVRLDRLKDFRPQNLSNTVWAYATTKISDHPKMFQQVAKAAIQRNEEFISQEVANLLWSYATLGIIDKQLFSSFGPIATKLIDNYSNQNLANIAWAYAVADIDAPTLFNGHFINKCLEKKDGFSIENLSQLHQWHLWQTTEKFRTTALPEELQDRCYKAFTSQSLHPSKLQEDVIGQLSSIGLDPKEEVLLNSGYRIDAIVEVKGKTIGVEVDGPSHFIGRSKSQTGSTIMKRRQVSSIDGIELVSVPYWEWDKLGKSQAKKQEYLQQLLGL